MHGIQSPPISRRTILRAGGAGLLGLTMPQVLRAAEAAKQPGGLKVRAKLLRVARVIGGGS